MIYFVDGDEGIFATTFSKREVQEQDRTEEERKKERKKEIVELPLLPYPSFLPSLGNRSIG